MSSDTTMVGYILGPFWGSPDADERAQHNLDVLASLPDHGAGPCLSRHCFAEADRRPGEGSRINQFIHFGGSFNHLDTDWHDWIGNFEELLCRLDWFMIRIYLETERAGDHTYTWIRMPKARGEPEDPPGVWEFEGGPRQFYR